MIYYSKILFAQREGIAEKNLEACGEYSKNLNNFFLDLNRIFNFTYRKLTSVTSLF